MSGGGAGLSTQCRAASRGSLPGGAAEVSLDGAPRIGRTLSARVRPRRSAVSPFCTALTDISPEDARRGRPLPEVLSSLRSGLGGSGKTWAAWGRDDETLARGCAAAGCGMPRMGGFLDLGALWGMLSGAERPIGLRRALEGLGMDFEGMPHRAPDDAVNAARVAMAVSGVLRASLRTGDAPVPGP